MVIESTHLKQSFVDFTRAASLKPSQVNGKEELNTLRSSLASWLDQYIRLLYQDANFNHVSKIQTPYFRQKISLLLSGRKVDSILDTERSQKIIDDTLISLFDDQSKVEEQKLRDRAEIELRLICKLLIADLLWQTHTTLISSEEVGDYTNYIKARFNKLPSHYFENILKQAFYQETDLQKKEFILDTLSGPIASRFLRDKSYISSILNFVKDSAKADWQKYFLKMGTLPCHADLFQLAVRTLSNPEINFEERKNTYKVLSQFDEIPDLDIVQLLDSLAKDLQENKIDLKILLKIICLICSNSNRDTPLHEACFSELSGILEQRGNTLGIEVQNLLGLALVTLLRPSVEQGLPDFDQEIDNICKEVEEISDETDLHDLSSRLMTFARAISENSSFFDLKQISSDDEINNATLLRIKIKSKLGRTEFQGLTDKFVEKMFEFYVSPYTDENLKDVIKETLVILGTGPLSCLASCLNNSEGFGSVEADDCIKASLELFDSLLAREFGRRIVRIHKSKSCGRDTFNSKMQLSKKAKKIFRKSIREFPHVKTFFNANNINYSLETL